jgi:isopenicillin-N epimerase
MPIEKLIPLCREFGVLSMIDGEHAPGHIPLNMRELDADFYAGKSVSI